MSDGEVVHEPTQQRFSLALADAPEPAVLRYRVREAGAGAPAAYDLYSTFVPEALRGRGVAGRLVSFACAFARERGEKIVPTCPYVPVYLKRHPEDADVVLRAE